MKNNVVESIIAISYSLLLHIVLLGLVVVGMAHQSIPKPMPQPKVDIVHATVMDEAQIIEEIARQKKSEETKRQLEQERLEKINQKLQETEQALARKEQEYIDQQERARIEQKALELKEQQKQQEIERLEQQQKLQQQKMHEAEAKRKLEEEKQRQAQQQRKLEEDKKQKAEQERRAAEEKLKLAEADRKAEEQRKLDAEKARKVEEERKRIAEAQRKAEEARQLETARQAQIAEADRLLQESLAAEQREQELRRVAGVVDQYSLMIKQRVKRYWIRPTSAETGLQCTLRVSLLPGGDVKQVTIIKTSGNAVFDRSAESAVYKAAPLPQPTDPKAAEALRDFQFIFKPE